MVYSSLELRLFVLYDGGSCWVNTASYEAIFNSRRNELMTAKLCLTPHLASIPWHWSCPYFQLEYSYVAGDSFVNSPRNPPTSTLP